MVTRLMNFMQYFFIDIPPPFNNLGRNGEEMLIAIMFSFFKVTH